MDEESSELLLPTENKKTGKFLKNKYIIEIFVIKIINCVQDFKIRKNHQQSRAANFLFFGLVVGFLVSYFISYSGIIDDTTLANNIFRNSIQL
jgi:uncharacterized ion transporter superfamily protein YfcC